jgi:hypothetical protein
MRQLRKNLMALKCNITTQSGVTISEAYCRAVDFSVGKNQMSFNVQVFADKDKTPVESDRFTTSYDLNGQNPYVQAYNHLKTLPKFLGAQDC